MSRGLDWPDVVLISLLLAMFTTGSSSGSNDGGNIGGGSGVGHGGHGGHMTAGHAGHTGHWGHGNRAIGPALAPMMCEDARLKCAYRTGCGMALQYYLTSCASLMEGDECTEPCQHALIALISTDEGKTLMTCQCAPNDVLCLRSKQRAETCRSSINNAMNRTRISCRIASWICNANTLCQTALAYYQTLCKSMFQGKKCTHRCLNSINILRRQEGAEKLNNCMCDGNGAEEYDCKVIHRNMNSLCFGKIHDYREIKKTGDTGTNGLIHPTVIRNNTATCLRFSPLLAATLALLFLIAVVPD